MCVAVSCSRFIDNVELGHHLVIRDGLSYGRHQGGVSVRQSVAVNVRTAAHIGLHFNYEQQRRFLSDIPATITKLISARYRCINDDPMTRVLPQWFQRMPFRGSSASPWVLGVLSTALSPPSVAPGGSRQIRGTLVSRRAYRREPGAAKSVGVWSTRKKTPLAAVSRRWHFRHRPVEIIISTQVAGGARAASASIRRDRPLSHIARNALS